MDNYCVREWLNAPGSSNTASVVVFDGETTYGEDADLYEARFLEIADCHNKIKLHQSKFENLEDYITKLEKLNSVLQDYLVWIKGDLLDEN